MSDQKPPDLRDRMHPLDRLGLDLRMNLATLEAAYEKRKRAHARRQWRVLVGALLINVVLITLNSVQPGLAFSLLAGASALLIAQAVVP
jgi:hypothetical protein